MGDDNEVCSTDKAKRMLIVGDTEAVRCVLQDTSRVEAGFDVETADSGAMALDIANKH